MTLRELSDLNHAEKCKHTSMPPAYVVKEKYTDKNEKGLMQCIEDYCELTGFGFFWRTPNKSSQMGEKAKLNHNASMDMVLSGMTTQRVEKKFGYSAGTNGMSDMAGFLTVKDLPISVALEIKIPGDTQKKDQIKFEQKVKAVKGIYIIVKDFPTFIDYVQRINKYYSDLIK